MIERIEFLKQAEILKSMGFDVCVMETTFLSIYVEIPTNIKWLGVEYLYEKSKLEVSAYEDRGSFEHQIIEWSVRGDRRHPHFSDNGQFCPGGNYTNLDTLIRACDLVGAIALLSIAVCEYAPKYAFKAVGPTCMCVDCEEYYDITLFSECEHCGGKICWKCSRYRGKKYCASCTLDWCEICDHYARETQICRHCGARYCAECGSDYCSYCLVRERTGYIKLDHSVCSEYP